MNSFSKISASKSQNNKNICSVSAENSQLLIEWRYQKQHTSTFWFQAADQDEWVKEVSLLSSSEIDSYESKDQEESSSKRIEKKIIDLNFYLGIGGVLTFKKSGLDAVLGQLNLDNIILETDAPYLAPVPFRGKRNECSYLKLIAEKLAGVKKMTVDEVANITTANAEKLFQLNNYIPNG